MTPEKGFKRRGSCIMDGVNESWVAQQRREYLRLAKANLEATLELLDASNLALAATHVSASIDAIDAEIERLNKR